MPPSSDATPSLDAAVRALRAGRLIVYPTDTLWGLGARAGDPEGVRRVFDAKQRPPTAPIAVAVSSVAELEQLAELNDHGRAFARRNLPGAYTVVVRPSAHARRMIAAPIGTATTLGLRIPRHPVARELARRAGPLTCTSANLHGAPATADIRSARGALAQFVARYVRSGPAPSGVPSTLVDLTGSSPRTLPRSS